MRTALGSVPLCCAEIRAGSKMGSSPRLLLSQQLLLLVRASSADRVLCGWVLLRGLEIASLLGTVLSKLRWGVGAR